MKSTGFTRRAFLKTASAGSLLSLAGLARAKAASARPHVVVIVLDTARRDHFSCYGYPRDTTPFLELLAAESTRYENAYAASCWTLPSHASLFTGLHLVSHGAHWEHLRLDAGLQTLPGALREHGYETLGLSGNPYVCPQTGFGNGFDAFSTTKHGAPDEPGTNFALLQERLDAGVDTPLFIFINFSEVHDPYNSSAQFFGEYLSNPEYADKYSIRGGAPQLLLRNDPDWITHLTEHYDAEMRYVDFAVKTVARQLQKAGIWDNTVFIVTSDHGENLGEHGLLNHQYVLYETLIRVPLLVRWPGRFPPGSTAGAPVQLTDIFPTVLELAGVSPEDYPNQGRSLLAKDLANTRPVLAEYYIHEGLQNADPAENAFAKRYRRRLKALRIENMKYIRGTNGSEELFDLAKDPQEQDNLVGTSDAEPTRQRMAAALRERVTECRTLREATFERKPIDEESRETLESLGYL